MADLQLMQPSFTAGELSPALYARVDLAKYQSGLKVAKNIFIHPHGGASNRAGLEHVAEVKDSGKRVRQIPFQFAADQSYILEFGHLYMRVIRDGALVLSATSKAISAVTSASPGVITANGHGYANGTEIVITGIVGMTGLNSRNFRVANASPNTFELVDLFGAPIDTSSFPAYVSGGTVKAIYELTTPFQEADLSGLVAAQELDVMYITHTLHPVQRLSRFGDNNWTMTVPTFTPAMQPPASITAVFGVRDTSDINYTAKNYRYKVSAVSTDTGEESLPTAPSAIVVNDLTISGNTNIISWPAVVGAGRYIVYKEDNGVYGYIGGTESLTFTDDNITADLSDTPQKGYNPFVGAGNYPRCVTFVEQRLALASTINNPQAVWLSQSANYENFGVSSPAKASDAITFRMRSKKLNEVRALLQAKGLMLLTSVAEWTVTGGGSADYLTPSNIVPHNHGYHGASALVQPIEVGDVLFFAQRSGGVIRDFSYEFAKDGYTGTDLTIMARHLFKKRKIVSWAYAQSPHSIVWVILDNGSMIGLTYLREHDVWAWSRHETDGVFEDVTVISDGEEDVPYFCVRRTINGQTKRYIERLHTREIELAKESFFVDSGLSYEGAPIKIVSGLWHLEGSNVVALADGNVVRDLTVENGRVELPNASSTIHVGLPYVAEMETLELDLGTIKGLGATQGRMKSVPALTLRVEKSRGMFIGPDREHMREWKQRQNEAWGAPIELFTGDFQQTMDADWSTTGAIVIQQRDPLPMTILGIIPGVELGR